MITCDQCTREFYSPAALSKHKTAAHVDKVEVQIEDNIHTVSRNADTQQFKCPRVNCKTALQDSSKFKQHLITCQNEWPVAEAAEQQPRAEVLPVGQAMEAVAMEMAPRAVVTKCLQSVNGLFYNQSLKALICLEHGYVVQLSNVESHMKKSHNINITVDQMAGFASLELENVFQFNLKDAPVPYFDGLTVESGTFCSDCTVFFSPQSSNARIHANHACSVANVQTCFQSPQSKSYFRVLLPEPDLSVLQKFVADVLSLGATSGDGTSQGRVEVIDKLEIKLGLGKQSISSKSDLEMIKPLVEVFNSMKQQDAVYKILCQFENVLSTKLHWIRTCVMSEPNQQLHGMQVTNTLKSYAKQFAQFISYLVCSYGQQGDIDVMSKEVLLDLVEQVLDERSTSNKFDLVVFQYLTFLTFCAGSCLAAKEIRHVVARLLYCLRLASVELLTHPSKVEQVKVGLVDVGGNLQALLTVQNLAVGQVNQANSVPNIWLSPNEPDVYNIIGQRFEFGQFCAAVQVCQKEVVKLLASLCVPPLCTSSNVCDDVQNTNVGFGLMSALDAPYEKVRAKCLADFVVGCNLTSLDPQLVAHSYFEISSKLLELILWLVHVTTGQPGRATELALYTLQNGSETSRVVYSAMGRICFVPHYNKTDNITQGTKSIARFCSSFLSDTIIKYLAVVRPIEVSLVAPPVQTELRKYLFAGVDGALGDDKIRWVIRKNFRLLMSGLDIGFHEYRQLAAKITSLCLAQKQSMYVPPYDAQRGHSQTTADQQYGVSNADLNQIGSSRLQDFYLASHNWQVLLGIESDEQLFVRTNLLDKKNDKAAQPLSTEAVHPQSLGQGSSQHVQDVRHVTFVVNGDAGTLLTSTTEGVYSPRVCQSLVERARECGFEGFLCSEQLKAACTLLTSNEDLIINLATGSGKTGSVMLPVGVDKKITVMVVPFRALLCDFQQCLPKYKVSVQVFPEWSMEAIPGVKLISADHVGDPTVSAYISQWMHSNMLQRIVIDEAQELVLAEHYRSVMLQLQSFRKWAVPLVLLTGSLNNELMTQLTVVCQTRFKVLRSTQLINPSITMTKVQVTSEEDAIAQMIRDVNVSFSTAKLIVFCKYINECERLVEQLRQACTDRQVLLFTGDLEVQQKQQILAAAKLPGNQVIVATSAFGQGVDIQGLDVVLHFRSPWDIFAYIQQIGRCGRKASCGTAKLYYMKQDIARLAVDDQRTSILGVKQMRAFLQEENCLYQSLCRAVDAEPQVCAMVPGDAMCSCCASIVPAQNKVAQASSSIVPAQNQRVYAGSQMLPAQNKVAQASSSIVPAQNQMVYASNFNPIPGVKAQQLFATSQIDQEPTQHVVKRPRLEFGQHTQQPNSSYDSVAGEQLKTNFVNRAMASTAISSGRSGYQANVVQQQRVTMAQEEYCKYWMQLESKAVCTWCFTQGSQFQHDCCEYTIGPCLKCGSGNHKVSDCNVKSNKKPKHACMICFGPQAMHSQQDTYGWGCSKNESARSLMLFLYGTYPKYFHDKYNVQNINQWYEQMFELDDTSFKVMVAFKEISKALGFRELF